MRRLKRIAALLLVIILVGLVFLTLYCAVTGSRYFMASPMTTLLLPVLLYAYMFLFRLLTKTREENGQKKSEQKK